MPAERIETLVIGGGQAGLTMSHRLKQRGLKHLVLERHRIAERWRSERWDGLKFQFPNWSVRLPEFPFPHGDPDAFAPTGDIIAFIEAYAKFVAPPIRCGVAVTRLSRDGAVGFVAETADGAIAAQNVVVATGPYQRAIMPDLLRDEADVFQVHASRYLNPKQLPPGAVLVIGAGASGAQITEELTRSGRRVFLSVGRHTRLRRPDVARIVLDPSRLGKDLRKLLLRDGDDRARVIEDDRTRASRALVQSENVAHLS